MKKRRISFIWVLPIFVLTVVVSTAIITYTQSQISVSEKDQDATPVREGVMTERQKAHSKRFDAYQSGKKISETISQQKKANAQRKLEITVFPGTSFVSPAGQSKSGQDFLAEMTAGSDAVFVGTVKEKSSQLTDGDKFIFTDYKFQVEDVVKNNSEKPVNTSELITIIRPGGKILLNGFTVTANDQSYQTLEREGKYILFLKFVPETGAYQSVNPEGSFLIKDGQAATLNLSVASKFREARDLSAFTADIYSALSANLPNLNNEKGDQE